MIVGGWTKTRPVSLGLLPSGPDPVGERYVLRQPPAFHVDHRAPECKGAPPGIRALGPRLGAAPYGRGPRRGSPASMYGSAPPRASAARRSVERNSLGS